LRCSGLSSASLPDTPQAHARNEYGQISRTAYIWSKTWSGNTAIVIVRALLARTYQPPGTFIMITAAGQMLRATGAVLMLALLSGPAPAADVYGLMRIRDLTPLDFPRLDMRPASALPMQRNWAIETEFATQNTWALSPNVQEYLKSLESSGRRRLGPADQEAIRALPGESYLVDLESTTIDVTLHHRLSQQWSAYLVASGVSYGGGSMDGTVENFHHAFGLSSFGRPAVGRNQVNMIFNLKSGRHADFNAPASGIADPTIGVRYTSFGLPEPWRLSAEAAIKVPIAGRRMLLSSGRSDYGVQAALQRRGLHHAMYLDVAAVYFAGDTYPIRQEAQVIPTVILGYEQALTARTNVVLQGYASTSAYSHRQTDLNELLANKYQVTIGVRHRSDEFLWSFGVTENVQNFNNTPDIGYQLGLAYLPARRRK
jgi:hypothetical protein